MFIHEPYGIAFQTRSGVPLGRKNQCFVKNVQQSWSITCQNCCLCILMQMPIECRWSLINCWDENRWFALRVSSHRIADRTLDYIVTWHCWKPYSSGEPQWIFLSFESRFSVWCKLNSALPCLCRKSNDQRSGKYRSRQQLWTTWQFKTTEWYNLEHMCTSSIIQHRFANTS